MPQTPHQYTHLREALQNLRLTIGAYLDNKSADVDHKDVIKELYSRTEMTGSYMAALIFANMIALLGLLSNSVAVVIGAMLISPLMGPIFSLGLSFAMGNLILARNAGRLIAISVLVTVAAAAFFTVLSPLKEVTAEILARTRPNIYDLLVAIFAGAIGAIALCTRKNYLFTTTGIAIATAVIPPLSVVGYGIGTLQLGMAMGGFLLFFTNLVAIVISSDIVFMLLRFRSSMVEGSKYPLRFRFKILGVTLAVISIPLIATLVTDLRALKLSKRIEQTLRSNLNVEGHSRLTGFSVNREEAVIRVLASVNTVGGIDAITEKRLNKELSSGSNRPINLELEQIIVKAGTIKPPETSLAKKILTTTPSAPKESLTTLRGRTLPLIKDACQEAGVFLAPWPVRGCAVTFSDGTTPTVLQLTIGRDFPLSDQEQRWLTLAVGKKLGEDVMLKTETSRLLPDLIIGDDGVPDDQGKKALAILKEFTNQKPPLQVTVSYPGGGRKAKAGQLKKAGMLRQYLVKDLGVPSGSIMLRPNGNAYRVTVGNVK
ncbi:MAG: DUF389 domain-containing protein [Deltaproteobacteria bacterium]|nr:DUF389 domain-containing protein [Deltaproteobacteria bacterium]